MGAPPPRGGGGEPEQRGARVLADRAGTRDTELVTAMETEHGGLCGDEAEAIQFRNTDILKG